MKDKKHKIATVAFMAYMTCVFISFAASEAAGTTTDSPDQSLWAHHNLFAWGMTIDSKARAPEEQALMLKRLGITQLAFDWEAKDIPTFEEQIKAFKRHGLKIIAWSVPDTDDASNPINWKTYKLRDTLSSAATSPQPLSAPSVLELLEMFKRHGIRPQLWLIRRMRAVVNPQLKPAKPFSEWTDEEKNQGFRQLLGYDPTATAQERELRVRQETEHIKALAQLAAPYGIEVAIYKHGGWIGITENQVTIIEQLKAQGITNVGIVYQFVHAHDEVDDTENFPATWKRVQPYVLAVNVTAVHAGRAAIYPILYPSQGELEIKMMKTIQDSGWRGPIGLSPEKGGDAEINLLNNVTGIDWIASELKKAGSGGHRPSFR
jgi:hypothetical protein